MEILLKLVSPAITLAKSVWAKLSLHWRVSRDVVARAKEIDTKVDLGRLRWQLESGYFLRALQSQDLRRQQELSDQIFARVGATSTASWDRSVLLELLRSAYIEKLQTPQALRLLHNTTEASLVRVESAITNGAADQSLFESRLERVPPLRAAVLRGLRSSWPQGPMALGRIVESPDPAQLLQDWASSEPTWLEDAPPDALTWLGNIALDHDASSAAVHFFDLAIDQGVSPMGYWQVRRVWASPMDSPAEIQNYLGDKPSYPLARMVVESTRRPMVDLSTFLEGWEPESEEEKIAAGIARAQLAENLQDYDTAIEIGRTLFRSHQSVGAGLIAVRSLLARNATNPSLLTRSDVIDARDLALQLRDIRRRYQLSGAEAVALAVFASQLLSDWDAAWKLTQIPPVGEATAAEAAAQVVRNKALLIVAEQGDLTQADELVESIGEPLSAAKARALLAARRGNTAEALDHWLAAMRIATDPNEKTQIAASLAMHGHSDSFLEELAINNPDIANDIQQTAELFSGSSKALSAAKVAARNSQIAAFNLLSFYARTDRTAEAAKLAVATANRWPDADTWRRAATLHENLDESERAIELARSALLEGGTAWGGTADCHFLIARCYSRLGDWEKATKAAADLVATDRESDWARWILVICQIHAGDGDAALASLRANGTPLRPKDRQQTLAWIELFRLHGAEVGDAFDLVELASQWKDDEEIRRHIVGSLIMGVYESEDSTAVDILPEYLADFPDANYMIPISIDEDRPFESLMDAISDRIDPTNEAARRTAVAEMDSKVLAAEMPLGMLGFAYNRTYAEAVVHRASHYRYAGPANLQREVEAVAAAVGMTTVVDTTAMFTQVLLSSTLGPTLAGTFSDLVVTSEQYRDSGEAEGSISKSSGMNLRLGGPGEPASGSITDPATLEERKKQAAELRALFGTVRRIAHPRIVGLLATDEERNKNVDRNVIDVLLSSADEAITSRQAFWSDDIVLRRLVFEHKIPTFGTPAVIEYLRQSGEVNPDILDAAEASLIANYYVGIQYRSSVFELAADLDGERGRGTLAAIVKSGRDEANHKIALALVLMFRRASDPDFIRDWANGIATWLAEVAPGDKAALVKVWVRNLLETTWISSSTIPFVFEGLKTACTESLGGNDVVFEGFHDFYRQLVDSAGYEVAAKYCIALVARLSDDDKSRVIGAIIADTA